MDEERMQRLKPYLFNIRRRVDPKVPDKDTILQLMQDLKDEGNEKFRRNSFAGARDYYYHAIFVIEVLERTFYSAIDRAFLGTIYCNAALCSLRMHKYDVALKDADEALTCQEDSIKAVYRKALSLKGMGNYQEALDVAQKGKRMDLKVFEDLVKELKQHVAPARNPSKVNSSFSRSNSDPALDWLEGTNALVTEKKQDKKAKKMPGKKKKSKAQNNAASKQKTEQKQQVASKKSDSDQDSDSSISDGEFAKSMKIMQGASKSSTSVKGKSSNENNVTKTASQREINRMSTQDNSELDNFVPVSSKSKSTVSQPQKKVTITWPLPKYSFRLVCRICFYKEAEGIKGYNYRSDYQHNCTHNILIVRDKNNTALDWLKIRPMPDTSNHVYEYKLCINFKAGNPCRLSEVNCTFAHNHVEINLWALNRDGLFNITTFIQNAAKEGIYSSEMLDKSTNSQTVTVSSHQYIPGLQNPSASSSGSTYIHPQPQLQQRKAPSSNNLGDSPIKSNVSTVSYKSAAVIEPNMSVKKEHSTPRPETSSSDTSVHVNSETNKSISDHLSGYKYKLCCDDCLGFAGRPWEYHYKDVKHFCTQHKLAFHIQDCPGQSIWILVRERTSHRAFTGNYNLCHSIVYKDVNKCRMSHNCSFAHNALEQYLWQQEKEGNFSISEFIIKHKQHPPRGSMTADSVKELIVMYGGYFRYICRRCFFSSEVSSKGNSGTCSGRERHAWGSNQILAHVYNGRYTIVDHPKFSHREAYYRLCKFLGYCERWSMNSCSFAHSKVEMSVWRLERDTAISRDEIIKQSSKLFRENHVQMPPPTSGTFTTGASSRDTPTPNIPPSASPKKEELKPPIKMTEFCRICWGNGQRTIEDGKKNKCVKGHSHFDINSVFIAQPSGKEIRSIPTNLVLGMKLVMCAFGNKCARPVCTHPHHQEEMDTWNYMLRFNVKSLKQIVERLREIEKANTRKISEGESVVNIGASSSAWQSQAKSANEIIAPGDMFINERYCNYCSVSCNDQRQWDDHCTSEKHLDNVNWDKEHQWNYRQPPWGQGSSLSLCPSHLHNKSCRYSHVTLDMYNFCKYAHSQEELDEWKERLEFRKMKRNMARQKHMFSFTDTVLDDFYSSNNSIDVLCEELPDVRIKCKEDLVIYKEDKSATFSWTFLVVSKRNLEKVGLLRHQDRLHFFLIGENGSRHQVASGDMFLAIDEKSGKQFYKIQVSFSAGLFGSFSQWLALDFGSRPVLFKILSVEVGKQSRIKELRDDLQFLHWTSQNQRIIRCTNSEVDEFEKNLLQRYKEPHESELVVTSDSFKELNQHNYTHKMHKLLELEEMTRQRLIARYNLEDKVEVSNKIEEPGAFIIASQGDVFVKAALPESLTEDTQAGELLLKRVRTVLMARAGSKPDQVYEAQMVGESNYNYDGRCKDYLYLAVCASSAAALSLIPGKTVFLEIQFLMDRNFFCHMHYALDSLKDETLRNIFFPDVNRFKSVLGRIVNVSSSVLNDNQMAAVTHIVKDRDGYTPPFVMYGPFGTGKTETLAQATMALLKDRKDHRILICTQSNSAADLYITKHFDKFVKSKGGKHKILRIYDKRRKINTVSPVVLPYCYKANSAIFGIPTKEYIMNHEVVLITVESSLQLNVLGLQNEFTHIFIDEAGQALECETLMPLTLASSTTCVVLTGDHVQISPPVYSHQARKQNFDMSMLVRLYNFYDQVASSNLRHHTDHTMKSPFNIFLSINYRTKLEILRFIATIFYGGPDNLKAYGKIPSVLTITPLIFYSVQGKELQRGDTTSYVNQAEAQEAVAQVRQLITDWPQEWGERNAESIAIITFYSDQVKYIRHMLKMDRSPVRKELSNVFVGTIQGVQGKEFRALYISTVRTTNILTEPHIIKALEGGDDIGDFGFLSNPKLINTAFTRAQSLVAVVGDPIALCMIGECIQEWRTFIKHCNNMGSLHPSSYSYDFIKNRVVELHMGPQGKVIELLSKQGQEKLKQSFPPLQKTSQTREDHVESISDSLRDLAMKSSQRSEIDQLLYPMLEELQRHHTQDFASDTVSEKSSFSSHPEHHAFFSNQLGGVSVGNQPEHQAFSSNHLGGVPVRNQPEHQAFSGNHLGGVTVINQPKHHAFPTIQAGGVSVKSQPEHMTVKDQPFADNVLMLNHDISCEDIIFELARESQFNLLDNRGNGHATIKSDRILVTEKSGFVSLHYDFDRKPDCEPFKIVSENEDFVAFTIYDQVSNKKIEYENWSIEKAKANIGQSGFLRCKLYSYNGEIVASVLASNAREVSVHSDLIGKDVELPHLFDCGHAFSGDEVLVKLYPDSTENRLRGQVKGILRRAHDPVNSLFVCEGNFDQPGVLKPIKKNMPSIYTLTIASRLSAAQKGNVCVYKFTSSKCIEFSHYEKLRHNSSAQRLFIVRYLTWPPGLSLPVGLVVGVLEPGISLETGMKILEVEHSMLPSLRSQAEEEARQIFERGLIIEKEMKKRQDLISAFCFSIVEDDSQDVEMAISIVESGGSYEVALHASDIAKFISKDSTLDRECELRGASFCPSGSDPKHMLPVQACLDVCSLKPNVPRLALSVAMRMDQLGNQLGPPQVFHSVISVKQSFSLSDIQEILQDPEEAANDYYKSCVLVLYQLSQIWRIQRLGNSHFCFNLPPNQRNTQHACLMVNELQHYFNAQVASLLLDVFTTVTPLQVQPPPYADKLMLWRKENAQFALNCIPMSRDFLESQVCRCSRACTCIFSFLRQHRLQTSDHVFVLNEAWLALCHAINEDFIDIEYVRDIISNIDNLPESYVAGMKFAAIQQNSYFVCSDHLSVSEKEHYTLCLPGYTYFTSPLRRFIGIVVQRLLSAYADGATSPYTAEEITEICSHASFKEDQLNQLLSNVFYLNLGVSLQRSSLITKAVIQSVSEQELVLDLIHMKNFPDEKLTLLLSALDPIKINVVDHGQKQVTVFFEERIYDHADKEIHANIETIVLEPHRFVCSIPSKDWQQLLFTARETAQEDAGEKESSDLIHYIHNITKLLGGEQRLSNPRYPKRLSGVNQNHCVPFSLLLQPSQYLQVQITSCLRNGLLKPALQLLSLTQDYDICLEHRQDPEKCFALDHDNSSSNFTQFSDINDYQTRCLHALASETAYQTVASGERTTIHSVSISWSSTGKAPQKEPLIQGTFVLSKEFCIRSKFHPKQGDEHSVSCLAFLCVRYSNMPVSGEISSDKNVVALFSKQGTFTWVGHCIVTSIHHVDGAVKVTIRLSQSSVAIPEALLSSRGKTSLCTIEWIERVKEHQVLDEMVKSLQNASDFVKDIVLGKIPLNSIDPLEMPNDISVMASLSDIQRSVLVESYREPISVICGCPGTGKSLLATLLSILFARRNKKADAFRRIQQNCGTQVLICSPTEKALDVIAGYFLSLRQHNIKLLRVYSEEVEESDFPSLGSQSTNQESEVNVDDVMKNIALHHLIRQKDNAESKAILEYEFLTIYGDQSTQIGSMRDTIERAQSLELKKADVILCTCITSSRTILRKASNIKQVILDDSSLISELTCLVPPVYHRNVNQMVVFGDQNMPSPFVHNKAVFKTGLSKSLLHRYYAKTLLLEQFRSMECLTRFPSNFFYDGLLTSGVKNRQALCQSIPWPSEKGFFYSLFCHVEGTESYTAGTGHDLSKISNQSEASFVMALAKSLIQYHNVDAKSIRIVTFSKAQSALLKSRVPPGITVCTVLESLGQESEYVIVSTIRSKPQGKCSGLPSAEGNKQHLGLTINPYFVNLALTRARSAMFIVGNRDHLSLYEPWKSLLHFYHEKRAIQANSQDYLISLMV